MMTHFLKAIVFAGVIGALASSTACAPIMYDADLVGKVIDAETEKPIPETVIMGSWQKRHTTLAGGHSEAYDALAVVADKDGEFRLPGQGFMFFTSVGPAGATVFKAGYDYVIINLNKLHANDGVVKLHKISKKRMRRRLPPRHNGGTPEKREPYVREIDKARVMMGLKPSRDWSRKK